MEKIVDTLKSPIDPQKKTQSFGIRVREKISATDFKQ
jgi:hypothetical protein